MELVTWLISSEIASSVAAVAALALTSLAILRDVSQRRIVPFASAGTATGPG